MARLGHLWSAGGQGRRVVLAVFVALALTMTAFALVSADRYRTVVVAKLSIDLADTVFQVDEHRGNVEFILSTKVQNPSDYVLRIWTVSWTVQLVDLVDPGRQYATFAKYFGSFYSDETYVSPHTDHRIDISQALADELKGDLAGLFAAYRVAQGASSVEALPWIVSFQVELWLDDFRHNYPNVSTFYLNELVHVELAYSQGGVR